MEEVIGIREAIIKKEGTDDTYQFVKYDIVDTGNDGNMLIPTYTETYSLTGLVNRVESLTLELDKYNSLITKINNL